MLRAILNKSWRQHSTRHQLYGHLPPITKTIQVRRARHVEHCWRSKDELISDVLLWIPAYGQEKARRPARTYIQQLCEDTGCSRENLPKAMNDGQKWRERVRDIRASGSTWWWWWWYIYIYIYIYIVIHALTVSLYHNSVVWLDTRVASSRYRNLTSGWWHTPRPCLWLNISTGINAYVSNFVCLRCALSDTGVLNSLEDKYIYIYIYMKSERNIYSPIRYIYIYIYIYIYLY